MSFLNKFIDRISKLVEKPEYDEYLKPGNVVQLVSKTSARALQICASKNDPNRLILFGDGPMGVEYPYAHFIVEKEARNGNLKFRNATNFVSFDNQIPCVLNENYMVKNEPIRTRNQFKLHEVSNEFFALESFYNPGKFLAVMADGSITTAQNKADEIALFGLNVIHVAPQNVSKNTKMPQQQQQQQQAQSVTQVNPSPPPPAPRTSLNENAASGAASSFSSSYATNTSTNTSVISNDSSLFPKLPPT